MQPALSQPPVDTARFTRNPAKRMQIKRIVRRYMALLKVSKVTVHRAPLDYEMDLAAIVGRGYRFDLDTLERFDDFNLAHDMVGIEQHLDRATGQLDMTVFLPRASRPYYIDRMKEED